MRRCNARSALSRKPCNAPLAVRSNRGDPTLDSRIISLRTSTAQTKPESLKVYNKLAEYVESSLWKLAILLVITSSTEFPAEPATKPATMDSARTVFTTVELVTRILESCAAPDLIRLILVNNTFKDIISTNKTIQQKLFFVPLEEYRAMTDDFDINPFLRLLAIGKDQNVPSGCDFDYGPAPVRQEELDYVAEHGGGENSSQDGDRQEDTNPTVFLEFDWERISSDPRFMLEKASWKRMLVSQPPSREVWNSHREDGELNEGESARDVQRKEIGGKRIGSTWNDVDRMKKNPNCKRLRTFVRSSERFGVVVIVNVEVRPINTEEDFKRYCNNPNVF